MLPYSLISLSTPTFTIEYMESPFNVEKQVGPCGIVCGACFLGSGSVAKSAKATIDYIKMSGIKEWAPMVPQGADLNWGEAEKVLGWMTKYAFCAGCEKGGGPPNCAIRSCANEKKLELCNDCGDLDECNKFNWLGESSDLKKRLKENSGKTREVIAEETIRDYKVKTRE